MNPELSPSQLDALLGVLYQGLLQIRLQAQKPHADIQQIAAIAEALHNIAGLLTSRHFWTLGKLREHLARLLEAYPECTRIEQAARRLQS